MSKHIFWEIHSNLPREGPGTNEATRKAFEIVQDQLPDNPAILDVGCGPGMQTIELARLTKGSITAVDQHEPFLNEVSKRADEADVAERVKPMNASMFKLPFEAKEFDLIWSEGAIYIIGFEKGLIEWRPLLKSNGFQVASELTWLTDERPEEIEAFWSTNYPAMKTIRENHEIIRNAGYELVDSFVLDEAGWWGYYQPIEQRISELRETYRDQEDVLKILAEQQYEVTMYQKYGKHYGYVFYIMRKTE